MRKKFCVPESRIFHTATLVTQAQGMPPTWIRMGVEPPAVVSKADLTEILLSFAITTESVGLFFKNIYFY